MFVIHAQHVLVAAFRSRQEFTESTFTSSIAVYQVQPNSTSSADQRLSSKRNLLSWDPMDAMDTNSPPTTVSDPEADQRKTDLINSQSPLLAASQHCVQQSNKSIHFFLHNPPSSAPKSERNGTWLFQTHSSTRREYEHNVKPPHSLPIADVAADTEFDMVSSSPLHLDTSAPRRKGITEAYPLSGWITDVKLASHLAASNRMLNESRSANDICTNAFEGGTRHDFMHEHDDVKSLLQESRLVEPIRIH